MSLCENYYIKQEYDRYYICLPGEFADETYVINGKKCFTISYKKINYAFKTEEEARKCANELFPFSL